MDRADATALRGKVERAMIQAPAAEALAAAEAALARCPDDPALNVLAGRASLAADDPESALDYFDLALHYDPTSGAALEGQVASLRGMGRGGEVSAAYEAFLEADPTHRGALYGLALEADEHRRTRDVKDLLERLLAHHPADADALNLLGLVRAREQGDFAGGEALLRRALDIAPGNVNAVANLGWVLAETGRHAEGLAMLDRILEARPRDAELRLMRAIIELKRGNFARGWQDYGARFETGQYIRRPFNFPDARGASPAGRRVLVYGEQGLGDQIMFASCIPDLLGETADCVLDCDPRLAPLFDRSFPAARVVGTRQDDPAPAWLGSIAPVDMQIPIGDLAVRYRRTLADFPAHRGYLRADPVKVARYVGRLRALGQGMKIGLSWRGGTKVSRRDLRSMDLASLTPLLKAVPACWVSLQYTPCSEEIAALAATAGVTVHHWQEAIDDYDETAALVGALDGVVSVCTAVVHLAGALGRRALVMAPSAAEWRYGQDRETMPWYPSVRLLRQSAAGDWAEVLEGVRVALAQVAAPDRA